MKNRILQVACIAIAVATSGSSALADFGDDERRAGPSPAAANAMDSRQNAVMQEEVRRVANYMENWCMRNSRFPTGNDETAATRAQLGLLVPENPYNLPEIEQPYGYPQPVTIMPGDQYHWNQNIESEEDSSVEIAQNPDRVRLVRDDSLTLNAITYYQKYPPTDWRAPAGTITCVGNNSGLVMVWGAGRNGRPIRDGLTGRLLLIAGMWGVNQQDMNSPNEDF